ncbi:DUF4310 family protein [Aeromonas veronii]|uniref:DUF4310 family protein n=1 Tax=Aeromonas TaxID=642 RepID=UPI000CCE5537|nr:DUF4310 family protein [Aeromonas veronii]MCR3961482.1 DUF4310 family protein [Aeromonas veronii]PNW68292.1 hypothetical protein C2U29_06945 [Aeromonas veronii]
MDEKLKNNFWYADWSFPIFVGLLSAGVFAGTHMFYLYGVGAFNEVAFVAMLKAGMDTGAYGAVAAFGASFLFARIIEGSLVGILDIGGAIQTGVGLGVPALLLGAGIVYPVENFGASLATGMGIGLAIGYVIILARRTLVYTVLAPQGIDWGNGEIATLIFVLAISKADYEEAMGLYDLFLALMNEKASRNLLACRDFASFKALVRTGS